MKRIIALVICMIIIFTLAACSSQKKIVGRWIVDDSGYFNYIEFFSDGTYSSSDSNYQGSYSIDGNRIRLSGILVSDKTFDFSVHGNTLTLDGRTYSRDK